MPTNALGSKTFTPPIYCEDKSSVKKFVFVIQLMDGRIGVGQSDNPVKRIAAINSGYHKDLPKSLQVHTILGIKDQANGRSLISVVKHFCDKYGDDKVICF